MPTAAPLTRVDWYDEPRYYDLLFEEDTPIEASFLEAMLARHGRTPAGEPADVLEPACGSGRLVHALAARGHRVAGFDLSQPMLDFAARRIERAGLTAELFRAPMQAFTTRRRFDLVFCLVSSFRYLLDETSAREHLSRAARALRPGGIYVLGLHLTQYDWQRVQRERWVGKRGATRVVCNLQSWPPERRTRRERLRSRLTIEERGRTRRMETHWEFRTYDARQLRRLLRSVPELELVTTYDFSYELESERALDDEQLDCVLVLRRAP